MLRFLIVLGTAAAVLAPPPPVEWTPASFHGLHLGASKRADVFSICGPPEWSGPPEDEYDNPVHSVLSYHYDDLFGFIGATRFWMDAKSEVLETVILEPASDMPLSLDDALARYGSPTTTVRHYSDICRWASPAAPTAPGGDAFQASYLVYPRRGLYLHVRDDGTVQAIVTSARCEQR